MDFFKNKMSLKICTFSLIAYFILSIVGFITKIAIAELGKSVFGWLFFMSLLYFGLFSIRNYFIKYKAQINSIIIALYITAGSFLLYLFSIPYLNDNEFPELLTLLQVLDLAWKAMIVVDSIIILTKIAKLIFGNKTPNNEPEDKNN